MTNFVLVHGAFCSGSVWRDLAERLEKAGHGVAVVEQLPSCGTDPSALGDLGADAECVREIIDSIDTPVVLVGHSYGGMVITELADHPNVRHSVYLAAFFPQRGQSAIALLGGRRRVWIVPCGDGSLRTTEDLALLRESLCADLEPDRASELFSRMTLQSAAAHQSPSTAPGRRHPTTYAIAEQESDKCIPVNLQEAMSEHADHVIRLPCAHMMQLTCADELAEFLGNL